MIQPLVYGWKHYAVPLGLLSLIEVSSLTKAKTAILASGQGAEGCVSVCLHICMCIHSPGSVCSHISCALFSLLDTGWSASSSAHLSLISDAIAVKHLVSFLMVLQMCIVYFLSEGLETVICPVAETEQQGRALLNIWHRCDIFPVNSHLSVWESLRLEVQDLRKTIPVASSKQVTKDNCVGGALLLLDAFSSLVV